MKTQIITNDTFYVEIVRFCEVNDISDIDQFISECLKSGFFIQKYGMLNDDIEPNYIEPKEIIVEKIVEVTKEIPIYKEIIRDVPNPKTQIEVKEVEVIKEVPVIKEVFVLKEILVNNPDLENELNDTKVKLNKLISELEAKNRIIQEYRAIFETSRQTARYHKSSNIKIS